MRARGVVAIAVVMLMAFVSVAGAQTGTTAYASAEIRDVQGRVVGNALLTQTGSGPVRVQVQVAGFAPGESRHGIHFHMVGTCTPDFTAAGEHFNPAGLKHGLENPNGPHNGDLPNMTFNADGSGAFDANTELITLGQGANSIFDADGTALIIHAGMDDQVTDPAGNSGDRIACGVLVAGRGAAGTVGQAATASPTTTAAATAAATATVAATSAVTSTVTADATPAATADASTTAATTGSSPATLPTTGGELSLLPAALLTLGGALAAGGAIAWRKRK